MTSRAFPRFGGITIAASIGAVLLAAPTTAIAQTPGATADQNALQSTTPSCTISDGTLSWGVKESFRAYISGSIANGEWETSDGAAYETPDFLWTGGTGSFDPATGTGSVSFPGTVHFTGHDGVLDLALANPTIEFEGGGSAALLLDARSNDMEGEVAVDAEQEWVGEISLADDPSPADGTIELVDLPTTLTNPGAAAFAGFYEAGEELDPVSVTLQTTGCDAEAAAAPGEPAAEETPVTAVAEDESGIPWMPIIVGGAALIVIGLTAGLLIGGRRPKPANAATSGPEPTEGPRRAEDPETGAP